ncbi:glycosyltransferase, partial [Colwellia sp. 75C3]|uniref:glycosyltransferase n=1 Tax=Colwellia sp. 75C3 TaxID=888425 RepID=UPI001E47A2F1
FEDYPMTYGWLLGNIMWRMHCNALSNFDKVATVSDAVKKAVSTLVTTPLITVNNGVDTSKYKFENIDNTSEYVNLLHVGHISARKDPETIISAVINYNERPIQVKKLKLTLVGGGELYDKLHIKWQGNEYINVIGRVSNVENYLSQSDIFVSASLSEGFPNSVLEALSSGLPCVLSDIPQHAEFNKYYIENDEFILFRRSNVTSLVQSLDKFIKSIHGRNIGQSIRVKALTTIDYSIMSRKYQDIYSTISVSNI